MSVKQSNGFHVQLLYKSEHEKNFQSLLVGKANAAHAPGSVIPVSPLLSTRGVVPWC